LGLSKKKDLFYLPNPSFHYSLPTGRHDSIIPIYA